MQKEEYFISLAMTHCHLAPLASGGLGLQERQRKMGRGLGDTEPSSEGLSIRKSEPFVLLPDFWLIFWEEWGEGDETC